MEQEVTRRRCKVGLSSEMEFYSESIVSSTLPAICEELDLK